MVNYIISYRHTKERYQNLKRVLNWLKTIPFIRVTIVEQDTKRRMPENDIDHILAYDPRGFNRAYGFNVGVKESISDIFIFGDGDLIVPTEHLVRGISSINNQEFDVISPYDRVIDLTKIESKLAISKIITIDREGRPGINFCGGITIWSKSAIYKAGLWEEDLNQWGVEDNIQTLKLYRLEMECGTIKGNSFHLHHERSPIVREEYLNGMNLLNKLRAIPIEELKQYLDNSEFGNKNRFR